MILVAMVSTPATADEQCSISVLNQSGYIQPDGSWMLPNVPANMGLVRARVNCQDDTSTTSGVSGLFQVGPNVVNGIARVHVGDHTPMPRSISVTVSSATLRHVNDTVQLTVRATYPDGSTADVTARSGGTTYFSSNSATASVSDGGLVTAHVSGRVLVSTLHEAIIGAVLINVTLSADTDGDGMPDDWEVANELDPNNPADALEDPDADFLTNLDEFNTGTLPRNLDTDGDTIRDGEETILGQDGWVTSPVLADTDGDCIRDPLEILMGTDPTDSGSGNLAGALDHLIIDPAAFTLYVNVNLAIEASRLIHVKAVMIDGSECDITQAAATEYLSDDPLIASIGPEKGRVYGAAEGTTIVHATHLGRAATTSVAVVHVQPTALGFVAVPGYANGIALEGGHAFIASGVAGLQVVDISNPTTPVIVGALDTPGSSKAIALGDATAYVADGYGGLQIMNISNPSQPTLLSTTLAGLDTMGVAYADGHVCVILGNGDFRVIDVRTPTAPVEIGAVSVAAGCMSVDVIGATALLACDLDGLLVVDVSNRRSPAVLGSCPTDGGDSHARAVVARGTSAYVADGAHVNFGGLRSMDVSIPSTPFMTGATEPDFFALRALAVEGRHALGADFLFNNDVPIYDIAGAAPAYRDRIDFSGSPSSRLDNGTGIAVRNGFVYMTGCLEIQNDFWGSGDCALHVGQYAVLPDAGSAPPSVELQSPVAGSPLIERTIVTVMADAEDDVALSHVEFYINGDLRATDNAPPWQADLHVPSVPAGEPGWPVVFGARAVDVGGSATQAEEVTATAVPDQNPTVRLLAPRDHQSVPIGTSLHLAAEASDDVGVLKVVFTAGMDSLPPVMELPWVASWVVPPSPSTFEITATAYDDSGNETTSAVITVTAAPDQPPMVAIIQPCDGGTVIESDMIHLIAVVSDDGEVTSVEFFVDSDPGVVDNDAPYDIVHPVSSVIGDPMVIWARALDNGGLRTDSAPVTVHVVADPLTTVTGQVLLQDGSPAVGATVTVLGRADSAGTDGHFVINGVATNQGALVVASNSGGQAGSSTPTEPVRAGTTDVGTFNLVALTGTALISFNASGSSPTLATVDISSSSITGQIEMNYGAGVIGFPWAAAVLPDHEHGVVVDYWEERLAFIGFTPALQIEGFVSLNPGSSPYLISPGDVALVRGGDFAIVGDLFGGGLVSIRVNSAGPREVVDHLLASTQSNILAATPDGAAVMVVDQDSGVGGHPQVTIVTVSADGLLAEDPASVITLSQNGDAADAAVTSDGERLVVARRSSAPNAQISIVGIQGTTLTELPPVVGTHAAPVLSLALTPAGDRMYMVHEGNGVGYLEVGATSLTDSGVLVWNDQGPPGNSGVRQAAVTADGLRLYVLGGGYGLMMMDLGSLQWDPPDNPSAPVHCPKIWLYESPDCVAAEQFFGMNGGDFVALGVGR